MNKLFKSYLIGLTVLIIFPACEDVIEIETPEDEARLVVEGWVYDNRNTQTVILTQSAPYFDAEEPSPETNAQLSVTTSSGEIFNYVEIESGIYSSNFRGIIGEEYTLNIETSDGQQYRSSAQILAPVAPLDSVYSVFKESPEVEDEGYYPAWNFTDPIGEGNYYRWKFYVNDTLQNLAQDILVFSDEFIDGEEITGVEFILENALEEGDFLTLEQLSITEESQNFLNRIQQLTAGVGGLFDTPPDPVQGNITNLSDNQNYALGFFGASSVVSDTIVVGE